MRFATALTCAVALAVLAPRAQSNPHVVVYQGDKGPGAGKHIVWLAGDDEYRSEESLPALARIMAQPLRIQVQCVLH